MLPPWPLGLAVAALVVLLSADEDPLDRALVGVVAGEVTALVGLFVALRLCLVALGRPMGSTSPGEVGGDGKTPDQKRARG